MKLICPRCHMHCLRDYVMSERACMYCLDVRTSKEAGLLKPDVE